MPQNENPEEQNIRRQLSFCTFFNAEFVKKVAAAAVRCCLIVHIAMAQLVRLKYRNTRSVAQTNIGLEQSMRKWASDNICSSCRLQHCTAC